LQPHATLACLSAILTSYTFCTKSMFNTISPNELLHSTARKDYQLIDLRSPSEFHNSSIAGSLNIPYVQLPSSISDLSQDKKVVLICNDGNMAGAARNFLKGYARMQDVVALENGMAHLDAELSVKKAG